MRIIRVVLSVCCLVTTEGLRCSLVASPRVRYSLASSVPQSESAPKTVAKGVDSASPSAALICSSDEYMLDYVQTRLCRYAPLVVLGYHAVSPRALDAYVASLWSLIVKTPFFHHQMAEALIASGGFVFAIMFWSSAHYLLWPSGIKRERAMQRYRIDKQRPVEPFEWAGRSGVRRFFGSWQPLVMYLAGIKIFHCFITKPPLPTIPPSFFRLFVELITGILAYDLAFAPIHRLLHLGPKFMRKTHHRHHAARPPQRTGSLAPLETVQHSLPDGTLQVLVNVAVQRYLFLPFWGNRHPLSKLLHNILVTWLLTEAHSGYDLPFMSHRVYPRLLGGAPNHDKHHRSKSRRYYHQFLNLA